MRILADMHISPRTVQYLRSLRYDIVRVSEILPPAATDQEVIDLAREDTRAILTQDLGFSARIALSGIRAPSLVSLRLSSSRIEHVNNVLKDYCPRYKKT
ncbi:MAG: DUF5615 family PIN-like protein [Acidobacteriota bacterium]